MNKVYPSDLTDEEFGLIEPLIPLPKAGGRKRSTDVRAVINAIFYLLRTGCQWRMLPKDFPPWGTVHYYFRCWRIAGVWHLMHQALYVKPREQAGKDKDTSVGIIDSQSVKTTEKGALKVTMPIKELKEESGIF